MDEELLRIIDLFDNDEVTTADKIDRPSASSYREEFDDFNKRNPFQVGGRPGFKDKGFVQGSALESDINIKKVKKALNSIKKQRNKKQLFEWSEKSDWYKKLQKDLGGKKPLNREYTNKLINKTVDEFFPNAYHGKNAIKNFRNDMVVNSFINHLKQVGEFDGQEKFAKSLEQFTKGKDADHLYEGINKSWKSWIAGEFEVDGINRAQLKKELKARGVDYNKINNWSASASQKRGKLRQAAVEFLNNQNKNFPNRSLQQVENIFNKKFPNRNFYYDINTLTQIKNTGIYKSGDSSISKYATVEKGNRAKWLKEGFGKQFAGNYSKLINAADQLTEAGETAKAKRLYDAANKFFGPNGLITKASGEGEHALARSFDFLNPERQLAINSLVSGDLNQLKKNLFDIPVKQYFDEYNNPETTKARRVELKNLIENRKTVMNSLTGGQTTGIVAGDIVKFRYGPNKIKATSNVPAIDTLFDQGKFDIDSYIQKGNAYGEAFKKVGEDTGVLTQTGSVKKTFQTPIGDEKFTALLNTLENSDQIKLARIGCPGKAMGGRIGYFEGQNLTACAIKGADKLKNNPTNLTGGDQQNLRNLTKSAKAVRFLKNFLGPGAVVGELIFEGGVATNKFLGQGMPIKQALGESYINKYILGPKSKIDVAAERKKELLERKMPDGTIRTLQDTPFNIQRGEEFAAAERGRTMEPFMAKSATADAQRLKKREEAMKALESGGAQAYTVERPEFETDKFINEYLKSTGQPPLEPGQGTLIRMNLGQQGLYGTQDRFAGGGIAGLSGGINKGPQRTSMNPDSQGLRSLRNRARNL